MHVLHCSYLVCGAGSQANRQLVDSFTDECNAMPFCEQNDLGDAIVTILHYYTTPASKPKQQASKHTNKEDTSEQQKLVQKQNNSTSTSTIRYGTKQQ